MLQTWIQIRKEDYTPYPKPTKVRRKAPDVHRKALAMMKRMELLISFSEPSALLVSDNFYTSQNYLSVNVSLLSPLLMGGLTCVCGRHEFSTRFDLMWLLFIHFLLDKKQKAKMLGLGFFCWPETWHSDWRAGAGNWYVLLTRSISLPGHRRLKAAFNKFFDLQSH